MTIKEKTKPTTEKEEPFFLSVPNNHSGRLGISLATVIQKITFTTQVIKPIKPEDNITKGFKTSY